MGLFYKMFCSDVFTVSDEVSFSRSEYQNYNFVKMNDSRLKITVPVKSHSLPINEVMLADWSKAKQKMLKTLRHCYSKCEHFDDLNDIVSGIFSKDFERLCDLNLELLLKFKDLFGIDAEVIMESSMGLKYDNPSSDICDICKKTGADVYLSGKGALDYIDLNEFDKNGVRFIVSNYEDDFKNLSVFDYVARNGFVLPEKFYELEDKLWKM